MTQEEQILWKKINIELLRQFPDLNPKIVKVFPTKFTYELEKHNNYTYYAVGYSLYPSGELNVDWDNAELTII